MSVLLYFRWFFKPRKGLKKMKKTVTSLLVSSLILTSVASAQEIKKTDYDINSVTAKCVYAENFSPGSCYKKIFKYWGQCTLPSIPGIGEDVPETDTDISVPENNLPENDNNLPQGDNNIPENNIPENETVNQFALEVLELVNKERAAAGLKALTLDASLSKVAENHSLDMAKNNYFSHTNLKGQSPFDRLKNAGISYSTAGENIAMGQKTPQSVVSGWMNSSGHRANILNSNFGKMGLGTAPNNSGGYYWTQIFTN